MNTTCYPRPTVAGRVALGSRFQPAVSSLSSGLTACVRRKGIVILLAFTFVGCCLGGEVPHTNTVTRWPSDAELRAEWGRSTVEEVTRRAEAGEPAAQHYLALCYEKGDRVVKDPATAVAWYEKARKSGFLPSTSNLGRLYYWGTGVPRDYARMNEYFRLAADGGVVQAKYYLGIVCKEGIGVASDPRQAVTWFREAAAAGHADAMLELYRAYQTGGGAATDGAQGQDWLRRAAEAGSAEAECLYGNKLQYPTDWNAYPVVELPNNMPDAIRWYRRSAAQDFPGGQCQLGLCYLAGNGVEKDEAVGLEWIRKAADQGQGFSLAKLAELYAKGIGEPRSSEDTPIQLLTRAATRGETSAYEGLISRFRLGVGTEVNFVAASGWYCRAALIKARGYSLEAHVNEPQAARGASVDRFELTLFHFVNASFSDDPSHLLYIGRMYATGNHAPRTPAKAWYWCDHAAKRGSQEAHSLQLDMEKLLTPEEQAQARSQSDGLAQELAAIRQALER